MTDWLIFVVQVDDPFHSYPDPLDDRDVYPSILKYAFSNLSRFYVLTLSLCSSFLQLVTTCGSVTVSYGTFGFTFGFELRVNRLFLQSRPLVQWLNQPNEFFMPAIQPLEKNTDLFS